MEKISLSPSRILVVDDDQSALNLYKEVLDLESHLFENEESFDVTTCVDGDQAIEAMKAALKEDIPFVIAFVDIVLPRGLDGFKVAEHLRAMDPLIEIVLVTGYLHIQSLETARRSHPKDKLYFLQKPTSPLEMRQFSIALTAKWRAERRLRRAHERLTELAKRLLQTNKALSVLAENLQNATQLSHMRITLSISSKILPIVQKLRNSINDENAHIELDMLASYVRDLNAGLLEGAKVEEKELSPSELRIACMIKEGLSSKSIADQLCVSISTVKSHRKHIRKKLNLESSSGRLKSYFQSKMNTDLSEAY